MCGTVGSALFRRALSRAKSAGRSRFPLRVRGVEFFDDPARATRLRSQVHRLRQNTDRYHSPNRARAAVVPPTNALDLEVANVRLTHPSEDTAQTCRHHDGLVHTTCATFSVPPDDESARAHVVCETIILSGV
jgi:hypothetical protein